MKLVLNKKTVCLSILSIIMLCSSCCAWWSLNKKELNTSDSLINIAELSDEFMNNYFESYTNMTANGNEGNILIVISNNSPNGYGAKEIVEGPNHTYYLMYETIKERDDAYLKLTEDETISVEKNTKMELLRYMSWGIEEMGIDDGIIARGDGGEEVSVAIIDTGLDVDLFKQYYPDKTLSVYDVETNSDEYEEMEDTVWHGTHIAGTIAEGTTNQTGIIAIKATENDELTVASVNTAIYKAIEMGADVINMSFGGSGYSESLKLALDVANDAGIITVAAAGNDNSPELFYPAGFDNTISVSALNWNLERAVWDEEKNSGSNYNEMVDYAAPGTMIRSINGIASGTSVAAPHVTAAVAILKSYNLELRLEDVNSLLKKHVIDLGEEGRDNYYGYGMVDFNDVEFCEGNYCDEYGVFLADIPIEDLTRGVAEVEVLDDGIIVSADRACMVVISDDNGETYTKIPAVAVNRGEEKYRFEFEMTDDIGIMVILKGDGDLDGEVTTSDSNLINRSLISESLMPSRTLTTLEEILLDIDGDGEISSSDSNLINRSLISDSLRPYHPLEW